MKTIIFYNLTNGIESLPLISIKEPHFVRIQSTACEQKRWDFILQDLDHTFLLNLAIGNDCVVWDCSHKGESRALYQGLPWIIFALEKYWFRVERNRAFVKTHNVIKYFDFCYYEHVEKNTHLQSKLMYYEKFLNSNRRIYLRGCYNTTKNDGNYEFYVNKAKELLT